MEEAMSVGRVFFLGALTLGLFLAGVGLMHASGRTYDGNGEDFVGFAIFGVIALVLSHAVILSVL